MIYLSSSFSVGASLFYSYLKYKEQQEQMKAEQSEKNTTDVTPSAWLHRLFKWHKLYFPCSFVHCEKWEKRAREFKYGPTMIPQTVVVNGHPTWIHLHLGRHILQLLDWRRLDSVQSKTAQTQTCSCINIDSKHHQSWSNRLLHNKRQKFPRVTHGKELCKPCQELLKRRIYAKLATSHSWGKS